MRLNVSPGSVNDWRPDKSNTAGLSGHFSSKFSIEPVIKTQKETNFKSQSFHNISDVKEVFS